VYGPYSGGQSRHRAQHVHDPADYPPVIDPVRAALPARQQWLKPLPFRLAQPIKLLPHQSLLNRKP
jgi:hypothetical protein